ncbi:hypothetical protein [Chryseobacterium taiwanense]|nr:hypothetical protein [Chryseobacterium taiwanense]
MKKFRIRIEEYVEKAEQKWKSLPSKQQRSLTKVFFILYAILMLLTVFQLWSNSSTRSNGLSVGHINNIPKDIKMQHQPIENPANNSPYKTSP